MCEHVNFSIDSKKHHGSKRQCDTATENEIFIPPHAILIYGFGNPGRSDDGAGVACAEQIAALNIPHVHVETNFQLNIEDSLLIKKCSSAIFIDASRTCSKAFHFSKIEPAYSNNFTTHAMAISHVVALCDELFGCCPMSYLLEIQGHIWDIGEGLSTITQDNCQLALQFLVPLLHCSSPS